MTAMMSVSLMCHSNPQVVWDQPVCKRKLTSSSHQGLRLQKPRLTAAFVGSGGKSYELSSTVVVGTGRLGLPPCGMVLRQLLWSGRPSVLARWRLRIHCPLVRCVAALVNCPPVPRAWAEPPGHKPDTHTSDSTKIRCCKCPADLWGSEYRHFPGKGAGQGTPSLTHEPSREPDRSCGRSLRIISSC